MNQDAKSDRIPTLKSDYWRLDLQQNIWRHWIDRVDKGGSAGFKYN